MSKYILQRVISLRNQFFETFIQKFDPYNCISIFSKIAKNCIFKYAFFYFELKLLNCVRYKMTHTFFFIPKFHPQVASQTRIFSHVYEKLPRLIEFCIQRDQICRGPKANCVLRDPLTKFTTQLVFLLILSGK